MNFNGYNSDFNLNFNFDYQNIFNNNNFSLHEDNEFSQNDWITLNQQNNIIEHNIDYYIGKNEIENNILSKRKTAETLPIKDILSQKDQKDELYILKLPKLYKFDDIENIIKKGPYQYKFSDDVKKIQINDKIKIAEEKIKPKNERIKKLKVVGDIIISIENNEILKKKRGRKATKTENNIEGHNKMSPDNIIKKIKAKIFKYPIFFLNNISNKNEEDKKNQIINLDYNFVNRIKRDLDFKFLNSSLKDLFSMDISPKFRSIAKYTKNFNKKIIENILKEADDTIKFSFDIILKDWIDLFTYKRNLKDIMNSYDLTNYEYINVKRIEKCMIGVDDLLNKMALKNENDINYLSYFIFYLYNYQRWFYLKRGRNNKK